MPIAFHVTDQLSTNRAYTPEQFLIIRGSRLSRVGEQIYLPSEVPVAAGRDGLVRIQRNPEEVFCPDSLASFNGKPITLDHPEDDVNPDNWRNLAVGIVHDARRGEGDDANYVVGDLMITDRKAINAIDAGLRELSVGYLCDYSEIEPGVGQQKKIRTNHIALVSKGRCGTACAVADQHHTKEKVMPKKSTFDRMADKIRAAFRSQDHNELENILKLKDEEAPETDVAELDNKLDKLEEKIDDLAEKVASVDSLKGRISALDSLTADLAAKIKARDEAEESEKKKKDDEDEEEEKRKKKEAEGEAKDSAGLLDEWQDTVARAEIIAPGVQLPTHDGKAKSVKDGICALRRRALETAYSGKGRDAVAAFLGNSPDFSKVTCDAARNALIGASEIAKRQNNVTPPAFTGTARDQYVQTAQTISDINRRNKEAWAKHKQ